MAQEVRDPPAKRARDGTSLGARKLGSSRLVVSELGYGAWPLSYEQRPQEDEAIKILHRALDLGVRFIDTADAYCKEEAEKHHNERLIRKALAAYPDQDVAKSIVVATKGTCVRPNGEWARCVEPEHIRKAILGSQEALNGGTAPIDLWQVHWCNPMNPPNPANDSNVPIETILEPVRESVSKGIIRYVGLSNCTVEQIRAAQKFLPPGTLISVQNRFNLFDRSSEVNGVLPYCQENDLAFLPWSPLGGTKNAGGAGLLRDRKQFPNLNEISEQKHCTPEALVLAYMAKKWSCIVHITSARSPHHLADTLRCNEIVVTADEIARLDNDGDTTGNNVAWSC